MRNPLSLLVLGISSVICSGSAWGFDPIKNFERAIANVHDVACLEQTSDSALKREFANRLSHANLDIRATCGADSAISIESVNLISGKSTSIRIPGDAQNFCQAFSMVFNGIITDSRPGPKLIGLCGAGATLHRILVNSDGVFEAAKTIMGGDNECVAEATQMNSRY